MDDKNEYVRKEGEPAPRFGMRDPPTKHTMIERIADIINSCYNYHKSHGDRCWKGAAKYSGIIPGNRSTARGEGK